MFIYSNSAIHATMLICCPAGMLQFKTCYSAINDYICHIFATMLYQPIFSDLCNKCIYSWASSKLVSFEIMPFILYITEKLQILMCN